MFLFSIILIVLFLFVIGFGFYFSNLVIFPKTLTDDQVLQDYQEKGLISSNFFHKLPKEEIWLDSSLGYPMRGWFFAQNSPKTVILCHGITLNLHGSLKYFDLFYSRGFNILVYDHRNHGRSGGKFTTLGYFEKQDLKTWVDWIWKRTGSSSIVGIHGESMGAATALQHGAIDPRIAFYIADCPFSDLYQLLQFRLKADYKLPAFPLLFVANYITYLRTGVLFQDISPIEAMGNIQAPVLFIHGKEDTYIPPWMSTEMYQLKKGVKDILLVEGARHAKSVMTAPRVYEEKIEQFLKKIDIL